MHFEQRRSNKNKNKMSSDMGSVLDPKSYLFIKKYSGSSRTAVYYNCCKIYRVGQNSKPDNFNYQAYFFGPPCILCYPLLMCVNMTYF